MKRRHTVIPFVLAAALAASVLTACSSAGSIADLGTAKAGDRLKLGQVSFTGFGKNAFASDITWRVLAVEDGKALVITQDVIELQTFTKDKFAPQTWVSGASIRGWLNGTFFGGLPADVQARVVETTLPDVSQDAKAEEDTTDKLFLLSDAEAQKYFADDADRVAKLAIGDQGTLNVLSSLQQSWNPKAGKVTFTDGQPIAWWLRNTLHEPGTTWAHTVGDDGKAPLKTAPHYALLFGVRPAMWVSTTGANTRANSAPSTTSPQRTTAPSPSPTPTAAAIFSPPNEKTFFENLASLTSSRGLGLQQVTRQNGGIKYTVATFGDYPDKNYIVCAISSEGGGIAGVSVNSGTTDVPQPVLSAVLEAAGLDQHNAEADAVKITDKIHSLVKARKGTEETESSVILTLGESGDRFYNGLAMVRILKGKSAGMSVYLDWTKKSG